MITDSIDFSTVGAAVSAVLFLTLPSAEYTGMAENGGFVADDVGTGWGCQFSNGLAVFTDSILVDAQLLAAIVVFCASVGNPILSFNRINAVQAISVDVQRCHC